MNSIERNISVTRKTFYEKIEVTKGTNMIPIILNIVDFKIPITASAVAYVLGIGESIPRTKLCEIEGNKITIRPTKALFSIGTNVVQIRIIDGEKALVTFEMFVKCGDNSIKLSDQEEEEQQTLIEQLLSMHGYLNGSIKLEEQKRTEAIQKEKEERTNADNLEKSERLAEIATEKTERKKEINVERKRIDNLAKLQNGSTTGDAELIDIRVGADGKTYENAGEAVRGQVGDLFNYQTQINNSTIIGEYNKLEFNQIDGFINRRNGELRSVAGGNYKCSDFIECVTGESFIVTCLYYGDMCGVAYYDKDKKFISADIIDPDSTQEKLGKANFRKIRVHTRAHYVRFSGYKDKQNPSELLVLRNKNINQVVSENKKIQVESFNQEFIDISSNFPIYNGSYFTSTGSMISLAGCYYTDLIDIDGLHYDKLFIDAYSIYETVIYLLYDDNKNIIDYFNHKKVGINEFIGSDIEINFSKIKSKNRNAKYIRLCSYDYVRDDVNVGTKLLIKTRNFSNENVLIGKKWVACGDSFTEGGNVANKNSVTYDYQWGMFKTYPWFIGRRNDMVIVNEAKGGTCIALNKDHLDDPSYNNPFSHERYKNIPKDADYITLSFGINDCWACNLGTINDTTNATFYGAWNIVLEYLYNNHPNAKVGIINFGSSLEKGKDFRKAIREISKKWGVPTMDFMADANIPVMLYGRETSFNLSDIAFNAIKKKFYISKENAHPNLEADKYQSTFIEKFLRSL